MSKVCSFTGHRPNKFNFKYNEENIDCIKLKAKLIEQIEKLYFNGVNIFLTGCAMGVDMWCGEIVMDLIKKYNDIQLYCVLAFSGQDEKWNLNYKQRYKRLINSSTKTILVQEKYSQDCYFKRNKYLVDKSNIIFGVYDTNSKKSGTKNTLNYAINQNKEILLLDITNFEIYKNLNIFL